MSKQYDKDISAVSPLEGGRRRRGAGVTYNREWIIGRHGYKTPAAVRAIQKEAVTVAA
ncbi:MAG: hypothetical protein GXY42_10925 [Desulfovibrionales bacterium]|nr:hypothetical protein [Desulfovibrionales bacterium]